MSRKYTWTLEELRKTPVYAKSFTGTGGYIYRDFNGTPFFAESLNGFGAPDHGLTFRVYDIKNQSDINPRDTVEKISNVGTIITLRLKGLKNVCFVSPIMGPDTGGYLSGESQADQIEFFGPKNGWRNGGNLDEHLLKIVKRWKLINEKKITKEQIYMINTNIFDEKTANTKIEEWELNIKQLNQQLLYWDEDWKKLTQEEQEANERGYFIRNRAEHENDCHDLAHACVSNSDSITEYQTKISEVQKLLASGALTR